jgi:putative FmdB family regulatory protein
MPIYEYLCDRGHRFEALQRMTDEPVATCEVCGAPVQRVLHPVAVHFKGSGFYTTDYGRGKGGRDGAKVEGGEGAKTETASKNGGGSEKTASGSSSEGSSSKATTKD